MLRKMSYARSLGHRKRNPEISDYGYDLCTIFLQQSGVSVKGICIKSILKEKNFGKISQTESVECNLRVLEDINLCTRQR